MPVVNDDTQEVQFKLVFSGAALSGKTSNVAYVHRALDEGQRGDLISLNTSADRTLFFDYLPVNPVLIAGYQTKFILYTVPGQVVYNATRELVLRGVDGLVFVVDSRASQFDANREAWRNLLSTLRDSGRDLDQIPLIFQYNKRDAADAVPVDQLEDTFNPGGRPHAEAIATTGQGVMETLDALSSQVLAQFHQSQQENKLTESRRRTRTAAASSAW